MNIKHVLYYKTNLEGNWHYLDDGKYCEIIYLLILDSGVTRKLQVCQVGPSC